MRNRHNYQKYRGGGVKWHSRLEPMGRDEGMRRACLPYENLKTWKHYELLEAGGAD